MAIIPKSFISRMPWWASVVLIIVAGFVDDWNIKELMLAAWKTSFTTSLFLIGWVYVYDVHQIQAYFARSKSVRDRHHLPSKLRLIFEFVLLPTAQILFVAIGHYVTLMLALELTGQGSRDLPDYLFASFATPSMLALLPLALQITRQNIVNGREDLQTLRPLFLVFLLVFIGYFITLLNMLIGISPNLFYANETMCGICMTVFPWWFKVNYYIGIFAYLAVPHERMWAWLKKNFKAGS